MRKTVSQNKYTRYVLNNDHTSFDGDVVGTFVGLEVGERDGDPVEGSEVGNSGKFNSVGSEVGLDVGFA